MRVQTSRAATVLLRAATVIMRMSMDLNGITGAKPMNTPTAVPRASEAGEPCRCLNFSRREMIVACMAVNGRDGRSVLLLAEAGPAVRQFGLIKPQVAGKGEQG